ncbi:MAG: hypothetical protein Q4D94_14585 [Bacillota bacterium]|nr:hypothetical protein [Bacillota bacterium]
MPDTNIKYQKGLVTSKTSEIEADLNSLLADKAAEYDQILSGFTVSQCDQATALREEIAREKEALSTVVDFYARMLTMIHKASKDVETVEGNYSSAHITG